MRLFLIGVLVLLFTGCSKCTKDSPPSEAVSVPDKKMEDATTESEDYNDQVSRDEEEMDRQYEQDRERRKSLGNIPVDHPGAPKPNEDRD